MQRLLQPAIHFPAADLGSKRAAEGFLALLSSLSLGAAVQLHLDQLRRRPWAAALDRQ